MKPDYDVIVVGGGPAGASCGSFCAKGNLRTLILEKTTFPREKVCGDCINPACWPVLDRLGISGAILDCAHAKLDHVRFVPRTGRSTDVAFAVSGRGAIAIRRSRFDSILLNHARQSGAEVLENTKVRRVAKNEKWRVETDRGNFAASYLVAADGRNSSVARMLNLLPATSRDRVALQTHTEAPHMSNTGVTLQLLSIGYCGFCPVGEDSLNVCLVSHPDDMHRLRRWAEARFSIPGNHEWRTITPLSRAPICPISGTLLLAGDAARVVEPFTGDGVYYAIASGEHAAQALLERNPARYSETHPALYHGRLWVNRLAKWGVTHPRAGSNLLVVLRNLPTGLNFLTRRIVRGEVGT
jgi:geranylgeranyl reductase family protein